MSFATKLASFKKQKRTNKQADDEHSPPQPPAPPPPPPSFRVAITGAGLTAARLWTHFREVGGVLSVVVPSPDRAEAAFRTRLCSEYAVQRTHGSRLAPGEPPLHVVAISPGELRRAPAALEEAWPWQAPAVVVGGVGGSGTRWVSHVLAACGVDMGPDQNESLDNLTYTLLFKRVGVLTDDDARFDELLTIMAKGMGRGGALSSTERALAQSLTVADAAGDDAQRLQGRGNAGTPAAWLRERCQRLERHAAPAKALPGSPHALWGWKEPNSHIVLDRLMQRFPHMKYIHVVRSGLDMAHSENQNQLALWGQHFLGSARAGGSSDNLGAWGGMAGPGASLRYWCAVHKRVARLGAVLGPQRFCLLNFDALCDRPREGLGQLLAFLGLHPPRALQDQLCALVQQKPGSVHRWRQAGGLAPFDPADVAYVSEMGFDVNEVAPVDAGEVAAAQGKRNFLAATSGATGVAAAETSGDAPSSLKRHRDSEERNESNAP